jgi:heme exporter protein C
LLVAAVMVPWLTVYALADDGDHSRAPGYQPKNAMPMYDAGRAFYFHVPAAVTGVIAWTFTIVGSIGYLISRRDAFDRWAYAGAEVGLVFCSIVLVTGSIWAKATWGSWWVWDEPRLVTSLIIWFIFVGYMLVRSYAENREQGARFSAVLGILGYLNIPVVYFIGNKSFLHPKPKAFGMSPEVRTGLFLGMAAVATVGLLLVMLRARLARLEEQIEYHRQEADTL